ncbi:MAG: S1C family serine protease, partial [Solirubrobacterales bacterium]
LLKIDPADADAADVEPLDLSSRDAYAVGEPVAAIGSPFGERQSLSIGVISATDRSIDSLSEFNINGAIQTDASINPGNSGGPLLDSNAEVIGINQQIETNSGSNSGVGFAIPVAAINYSLDQLRSSGEVRYAYLGVSTQGLWPQLAEELGIDSEAGALGGEVSPGSAAADAGIKGGDERITFQGSPIQAGGDVIVSVDGKKVVSEADLSRLIGLHKPGETITLEIIRDGERREVDVELDERPGP